MKVAPKMELVRKIVSFFSRQNTKLIPFTATSSALFIPAMLVLPHFQKDILFSFFKTLYVVSFSPFRIGDKIRVKDKEGIVENVDMQFVILNNKKGKIFIPTNTVYNSIVELLKD